MQIDATDRGVGDLDHGISYVLYFRFRHVVQRLPHMTTSPTRHMWRWLLSGYVLCSYIKFSKGRPSASVMPLIPITLSGCPIYSALRPVSGRVRTSGCTAEGASEGYALGTSQPHGRHGGADGEACMRVSWIENLRVPRFSSVRRPQT